MADTKNDTSSKRWYLQGKNRVRYAGINKDGSIPEIDREALHRLISVKLAATGFEVPETSTQDEEAVCRAGEFRADAQICVFAAYLVLVFVLWADSRFVRPYFQIPEVAQFHLGYCFAFDAVRS